MPFLPMWRLDWLARALAVVGVTGGALVLANANTPVRGVFTSAFLIVAPGLVAGWLFRGMPWTAKIVIALGVSIVVNTLLAQGMLLVGVWSPRAGVAVVAVITGVLLARGLGRTPTKVTSPDPQAEAPPAEPAPAAAETPADDLDGTVAVDTAAQSRSAAPVTTLPMTVLPPARSGGLHVEVVRPTELGERECARWRTMQHAVPFLDNPFLAPEFAQAVGRFHDHARVAVLSDGPNIVGFFPFDRYRFGIGRPIAAGLTDSQGLVHVPDLELDVRKLLRRCGLSVFEFDHLVEGQPFFEPFKTARAASPVMDLSDGYEVYQAYLRKNSPKFLKTTLYKGRKMGREVGELRFEYDSRDLDALHQLMTWKSAQYRRTGRTDRFAQPWIVALVEHLLTVDTEDFGGVLSMLYAGDQPISGHFGLRSKEVLVGWFPAYDVRFAKYSPGLVQHLRMAEAAAAAGIQYIDMGRGDREYKDSMKSRELAVAEGRVLRASPVAAGYWSARAPIRAARNFVVGHPRVFRVADRVLKQYGRLTGSAGSRPERSVPPRRDSGQMAREGAGTAQ